MKYSYFESPVGLIEIAEKNGQLSHIQRVGCRKHKNSSSILFKQTKLELKSFFKTGNFRISDFPLLKAGTLFQQRVWHELRKIPSGEVRTYGEIAHKIGRPKASRAVGSACGKNPWLILTPCHRVVGSNNSLGGFAGGLKMKKALLELEHSSVSN